MIHPAKGFGTLRRQEGSHDTRLGNCLCLTALYGGIGLPLPGMAIVSHVGCINGGLGFIVFLLLFTALSWTFFGTVGQASSSPWSFLPIYLAPILVFTLGWRLLARLILIAKREHITSIADFIAARYGKSQGLAVMVTLIAVVGVLPYIALQLRGIAMGLDVLSPDIGQRVGLDQTQIAWLVCVVLAVFTVLFGTRHIDSTEHHRGMMMAVAFESVIKLVAFLGVGVFVVTLLFQAPTLPITLEASGVIGQPDMGSLIIHTFLTGAAIICLPRQFHTMVVENTRASDLNTARKVFPTYLLLMLIFVLPAGVCGTSVIAGYAGGYLCDSFALIRGGRGHGITGVYGRRLGSQWHGDCFYHCAGHYGLQ